MPVWLLTTTRDVPRACEMYVTLRIDDELAEVELDGEVDGIVGAVDGVAGEVVGEAVWACAGKR
jgi:hypothetical protein